MSYQISKPVIIKGNIARGFRAPNIAEFSSNGRHEGTFRYEIGNQELKAEASWQFDLGVGFNTEHITAELNLFDNNISNFIFRRNYVALLEETRSLRMKGISCLFTNTYRAMLICLVVK